MPGKTSKISKFDDCFVRLCHNDSADLADRDMTLHKIRKRRNF